MFQHNNRWNVVGFFFYSGDGTYKGIFPVNRTSISFLCECMSSYVSIPNDVTDSIPFISFFISKAKIITKGKHTHTHTNRSIENKEKQICVYKQVQYHEYILPWIGVKGNIRSADKVTWDLIMPLRFKATRTVKVADFVLRCSRPTWWRHQTETFFALLALCAVNSPVTAEFPSQRPVTRSFVVFFYLRLNKRLRKQSWGWWFEMPSRSLWRHCNVKWSIYMRHWNWWLTDFDNGGLSPNKHSI